jgi:hypothetical protein
VIALPARREPAPLITRPVAHRAHAQARPEAATDASAIRPRTLDERIDASVDAALAEALAKVKTPEDDAVAKQQAAFDQLMQLRTENEREVNAIREFGIAQAKKEAEFVTDYIRMI